ncbi:hypothetical protein SDC9_166022 [bioreactor metagenome]|uniref:Uncharacterized protein n=1 Tax=bioreactor metagenome TaxID=1076179 RepID=A0A645FYE6_9ZZZZ
MVFVCLNELVRMGANHGDFSVRDRIRIGRKHVGRILVLRNRVDDVEPCQPVGVHFLVKLVTEFVVVDRAVRFVGHAPHENIFHIPEFQHHGYPMIDHFIRDPAVNLEIIRGQDGIDSGAGTCVDDVFRGNLFCLPRFPEGNVPGFQTAELPQIREICFR